MYYGDVIASYKQVSSAMHQSLSLSLSLQAVDPSGKASATWVLLLHSARCILHVELQVLHVAAIIISLFKHDTKSEPTEKLPSL